MAIGAVAALTGRRPSSIRYYEQIGLLPPARRVNGRRVYGPDTVRTLAVIETGQRAGLTLDEIGALLSASPGDRDAIERLRDLAARKLPEITALIARTEIVRGWLESATRCECRAWSSARSSTIPRCPSGHPDSRQLRPRPGLSGLMLQP
jgi:MerR family redox-sensitive transcriptional activator SoxR